MSSIPVTNETASKPQSLFGLLWERWKAKRRRNRARSLSRIRFRLTREGYHFLFVLAFIFIGAVIREINLLILLAGTMIGLMIMQWRFSVRTLVGIRIRRRAPIRTMVGLPTEIHVEVKNTRRWLASWLILVEEPIQQLRPIAKKLPEKGLALVDSIESGSEQTASYNLSFTQRGKFRIGNTTISTRFPMGLGKSWRTFENSFELVVQPRVGRLLPACESLLKSEQEGHSKAAARSSVHEGEFFGLRNWQSGDSRRWIHWRTTARKGELAVRQFEQLQRRQLTVLVDLHHTKSKPTAQEIDDLERVIAFAATLTSELVNRYKDRIAIAIAGEALYVSPNIQSAILVHSLLDELAVAKPQAQPQLSEALSQLTTSLLRNPFLLVVSTRASQMNELAAKLPVMLGQRAASRLQVRWLDVTENKLNEFFDWAVELSEDNSSSSVEVPLGSS